MTDISRNDIDIKESCRICGSHLVKKIGYINPYKEYQFLVFYCYECGCRFVWRENSIHNQLHLCDNSPYHEHVLMANQIERLYQQKNHSKIKKILSKTMKFKFIIDKLNQLPHSAKILEIGCSQGYLIAYFLCIGYDIIGTDISETAVSLAKERFGDHFLVLNAEDLLSNNNLNQFDIIFSLGTIGCVNNPITFINNSLNRLKPGGILLFNCPDLQSIIESKKIWVTTPPPDLITVFPETFWKKYFSHSAEIVISYEPYDHVTNFALNISRLISQQNQKTSPRSIWEIPSSPSHLKKIIIHLFHSIEILFISLSQRFLPKIRLEYGQFVIMIKKA